MVNYAKWYINVHRWQPTREQWLHLTSSIDDLEITRINKFHYKEDSKSSLIGQALIRKLVSEVTRQPSNEIQLTRTEFHRPIVCKAYANQFSSCFPKLLDFNVSHSGDYCVLAGVWSDDEIILPNLTVGVDVTKIVNKSSKQELNRFLDLMSRREFTKSEWKTVELAPNDRQKCINFTRLWCLKESFIKSIGQGLSFKLDRISFQPEDINITIGYLKNNVIAGTKVYLDGLIADDWHFQETALDDEHIVAIGYNCPSTYLSGSSVLVDNTSPFVEITIDSLINALTPISKSNEDNWFQFSKRAIKSI